MVRAPRGGRKPASPERQLVMADSSDDGELFIEDAPKRQFRSGGKRIKKNKSNASADEDEDDDIYNSPGILRQASRGKVRMHTDDESSEIDKSFKGQTLEQLMMSPTMRSGDSMPTTPSRGQRQTKLRGSKISTPNGARMYTLDLGEARWTTTPTRHMQVKDRTHPDPLKLHLPFGEENGRNLKANALGLVEPSTFRNSVIRNKKRIARKGPEEGDILVCDEDNNTVVSDITEAIILDSSIRSTLSASVRSTDHEEYDEPLRDNGSRILRGSRKPTAFRTLTRQQSLANLT